MTQKTALILSVLLTAFVLVLGGGLVARVSQPAAPAEAAPVVSAPPAPAATIDVNAQVEQIVQQREAQYRQLIDEANQRLQQANQQLAAAAPAAPVAQPARSTAAAAPAAQAAQPTASLSAEAARNIAIDASGGATMIREPELVLFEGKVAYEVGFTRGVVYVDANDGAVLFNGTHGNGGRPSGGAPAQPTSGEHESEHEDSHEGESHD
jgi:hypothetical protein